MTASILHPIFHTGFLSQSIQLRATWNPSQTIASQEEASSKAYSTTHLNQSPTFLADKVDNFEQTWTPSHIITSQKNSSPKSSAIPFNKSPTTQVDKLKQADLDPKPHHYECAELLPHDLPHQQPQPVPHHLCGQLHQADLDLQSAELLPQVVPQHHLQTVLHLASDKVNRFKQTWTPSHIITNQSAVKEPKPSVDTSSPYKILVLIRT